MLDLGWSELLVVAVVMIVVVGPKDLPKMLRAFGKATSKLRSTANEFRTHFDEAMREAELDEVKKTIDGVKQYDPRKTVADIFEPVRSAGEDLKASLNASSKPAETPSVVMDTPLDLSKTDAASDDAEATSPVSEPKPQKAVPPAEPVLVSEPFMQKPAEPAPVKAAPKPRVKKAVTTAAKPTAAKSAAARKAAPKKTAPKKATTAKTAVKKTTQTGTDQ